MHVLASRFGNELYIRQVIGLPEESSCLRWQVELGMSYVAGRWHS